MAASPLLRALVRAAQPEPKPPAKPKPRPKPVPRGEPLPGYPERKGLDEPTIWVGKKKPNQSALLAALLHRH